MGWLLLGVALVVGVPAAAYVMQERLLFFPQPIGRVPSPAAAPRPFEDVALGTPDGVILRGWFVKGAGERAPLVLYYGGNAEELSYHLSYSPWPPSWSVLLLNYRGYGASEGAPGERALFADALLAYDAMTRRPDVDAARIVVFGRSLGSGVAVQVAANRPVAGVILVSPYDSITALARRHYPFLPASLLLRHPFDSLSLAPAIDAPMLAIVAERDSIIPPEHSRRLYDAWKGPKTWHLLAGADHNAFDGHPGYWHAIDDFLRSRESGSAAR